jgi:RimJ/RimL family protein N-acetyltransferase
MIGYFLGAQDSFLNGMGVARSLLSPREKWLRSVLADHQAPDNQKDRLYVGWFYHGHLIGHSSGNKIQIAEQAFFHLHLCHPELRLSGLGTNLCRQSIKIFFDRLGLERLWSEPYAKNTTPNRTFLKLGFEFVKRYRTVPGAISFEQDVNLNRLELPENQRSSAVLIGDMRNDDRQ